jgi:DNA-binding SARP family transcriptional activator
MPTSRPPGTPPARELLRGLAALLVATGIVVGLPAFLWMAVGWPLPHSIPTATALRNALFHGSISDQVILNGLALLTWLAWTQFLACLIAEIRAALHGRLPNRVPLAAWGAQALAARLVAATLLLAPLTTPSRPTIAASPVVAKTTVTQTFDSNIAQPHHAPTPPGPERAPDQHWARHVVQPRETLWDIAERHLGDGRLWPKIFESNRDRPQPDGRHLSNPNRIYPGWVLVLPDSVRAGSNGSGNQRAEPTTPPAPDTQPPTAAFPTEPPTSTPDHGPETPYSQHVRLPSGALVGITFATALSAALALAWLHRRRAYRPSPPGPGMRETDPLATPAVRRTCHVARQPDDQDADQRPTADAPISITRARKPRTERPPAPSHLRTIALGTRDGVEIPVDLAAAGILGFAGAGAHAAVRALIASALATGHGDAAQIRLVGDNLAAELLSQAPPPNGLTVAADLDTALGDLEVELVHRTRLLDGDEAPDIASFAEAHPAEPLPLLLLITPPPAPAFQQRLATVATLGRRLGIGAVLLGPSADGPTIELAGDGHVDGIDPPAALPELAGAWLFTLPVDEVRQVLAVIATAHGATPPPTPTAPQGEPPDQPSTQVVVMVDHAEGSAEPRPVNVRLFGPMRIDALGTEVRSGLRTKARELLSYLLLHPAGTTTDQIVDALWPDVDPQRGVERFRTTLGNLRSSLKLVSGQPDAAAVQWTGTHYRIQVDLFDCDTWQFQAALDRATREDDPAAQAAALEEAVACHRGDLLEGSGAIWVEPSREDLRRRTIDALVRLAELHQEADNTEAALHAIERAITLDPHAEDLYRRAMRLYAHLGRPDGVRRTLRHLENRLEELDVDLDEVTSRLAEKLLAQASEDLPARP